MFHKEGAQSILLGVVVTAVTLLLTDKFIDTYWIQNPFKLQYSCF